uniref:Uncharacterized protein n=1 Tax=Lutzomyia longipalpis TaxID=7200 RepID=A0A1B0CII8_LUTLO
MKVESEVKLPSVDSREICGDRSILTRKHLPKHGCCHRCVSTRGSLICLPLGDCQADNINQH